MSTSNALGAQDFFGKDDPEGVEKFKTVAFRVLYEQKVEDELKQMRQECDRLREDNTSLSKQLRDLQTSFDANMDDRERVLAFKSKRIEELHLKVRDYEATNMSLLQTINGGHVGGDGTSAGTHAAMAALVNSGKPLFHALETCKEQEYRRLYEDMRQQFEELTRQMEANAAVVREMEIFQQQKGDLETQLGNLQQLNAVVTADRDDKVVVLERKLVTEHDRLRKEKEAEIRVCQEAMETQMRRQLDVTTLRTIEENERVQLELRYLSAQLEKMVKHVDQLTAENKRTQHEKRIFEDMNASLSKKIKFYEQLFAKMQQQDHAKSQQCDSAFEQDGLRETGRFRLPRKPPLPSLNAAPPSCSPLHLPREADEGEQRDLDGSNQLNVMADALGEHLQKRDFTQKQVTAVIRYHRQHYQQQSHESLRNTGPLSSMSDSPVPTLKKKIMLSPASYSPSNYQRGRRLRDPPLSLDSFIRKHATIAPRSRTKPKEQQRPEHGWALASPAGIPSQSSPLSLDSAVAANDMWKASSPLPSPPATARF